MSTSIAAIIDTMEALGHKPEDILAVVKAATASRSLSNGAERTRRWREKKAAETACGVTVTRHGDIREDSKKECPQTPIEKTTLTIVRDKSGVRDALARLRQAYPRRKGSDPNDRALRALTKALASGATIGEIEAGAAAFARSRQGEDPKFTPMLATWLNGRCWLDDHSDPPPHRNTFASRSSQSRLVEIAGFGNSNDPAYDSPAELRSRGPDPGSGRLGRQVPQRPGEEPYGLLLDLPRTGSGFG